MGWAKYNEDNRFITEERMMSIDKPNYKQINETTDKVLVVQLITKKRDRCPICNALLVKRKCELVLYLWVNGEELNKLLSIILFYCQKHKYYFMRHKQRNSLKKSVDYKVRTKLYDEFIESHKPKEV